MINKFNTHILKRFVMALILITCLFLSNSFSSQANEVSIISTVFNNSSVTYFQTNTLNPVLVVANSFDSVKNLTDSIDASVGINAGAWNNQGQINFTYANGVWYSDNNNAYIGDSLACLKDGRLVSLGYNYTTKDTIKSLDPKWVVSGYNAVIYDTYCKNFDWNTKHDRTFIGQLADGTYIAGTGTQMTYQDLYSFAKSIWGDSIRILYNLDGGGSTNLYVKGRANKSTRNVPNAICFIDSI